jgi:hypothetical protein
MFHGTAVFCYPQPLIPPLITRLLIGVLLRPGVGVMDSEFIKQRAAHCRSLAEKADPFIKRRLLDLAISYDAKIDGPPEKRTFGIAGNLLEAQLQTRSGTGVTDLPE